MYSKVVTFSVFQPLKSKVLRERQLENNWYISVTLLVLKWLTSKLVRELQEILLLYLLLPQK